MHLGLDIGTSSVKALLMADDFRVRGISEITLSVSRPHQGWSEQDPYSWIIASETAITELIKSNSNDMAKLKSIGLSGQMHGATLLDERDQPLRPCILWNDGRSGEECAILEARGDFRGIGGNIVMAGFTAPKLEWVARHEPEIFERARKILLPKDFVRLWLTGEYATDMSDASGTLWLDVAKRRWSAAIA